jgi:hypothetical protein
MKSPDLCERAHCRTAWVVRVDGYDERNYRGWTLKVCAMHAEPYRTYNGPGILTP